MTKEQFYANDKEWLEQKARVVTYRNKVEECEELISMTDGEERTHLRFVKAGYRRVLCAASERLREIESRLDIDFRCKEIEDALCRSARFMDDDEIEFRILTNGYINGIKL